MKSIFFTVYHYFSIIIAPRNLLLSATLSPQLLPQRSQIRRISTRANTLTSTSRWGWTSSSCLWKNLAFRRSSRATASLGKRGHTASSTITRFASLSNPKWFHAAFRRRSASSSTSGASKCIRICFILAIVSTHSLSHTSTTTFSRFLSLPQSI